MHHIKSSKTAFWESEKLAYEAKTINDHFSTLSVSFVEVFHQNAEFTTYILVKIRFKWLHRPYVLRKNKKKNQLNTGTPFV